MSEKAGKELEQIQVKYSQLVQESTQHNTMFENVMKDVYQKTTELKVSTRRCIHPTRHVPLPVVIPLGTGVISVLVLMVPYG